MFIRSALSATVAALLLGASQSHAALPQLSPATPGALANCEALVSSFSAPNTTITSAASVPAGTVSTQGFVIGFAPAHCLVKGSMYPRTGIDGQSYAINFEMRLPQAWSGRFLFQGNGGTDGSVFPAIGMGTGGGSLTNALLQGFAVVSSDAGHTQAQTATFGFEPQARLDYGYQTTIKLTPVAKALIGAAYGRGPDRSYFAGCSNGGRHALVAASRLPGEFDGYLAGNPGFDLPQAAVAQVWGLQQWATIATPGATTTAPFWLGGGTVPDLGTGFTAAERAYVASRIVSKCDALDGATDGMVQATLICQAIFNINNDVPTCAGSRTGSCLTSAQKTVIGKVFAGAKTSSGDRIYPGYPYDPGIVSSSSLGGSDWAGWQFVYPQLLSSLSAGTMFTVPPAYIAWPTASIDALAAGIYATNATYTQSGMSFMTPPNPTDLSVLKNRGAKVLVYHGSADGAFSYYDTVRWYTMLGLANGSETTNFARLFTVPGMNHCSGGPSTDQFDMLTPLVNWVENGVAPASVVATARGAGNLGGTNPDVPSTWSASRTRPLCPFPKVAIYKGSGSIESAANFMCR